MDMNFDSHELATEKMFTYLKGFFDGAGLLQSKKALIFARTAHGTQKRDSGELYFTHPLIMACHATSMGIKDDRINATILLHDVVEDCGVPISALPVSDDIKHSVALVTFKKVEGCDKEMLKEIYFNNIANDYPAAMCKLFDRCHNVSTMAEVFTLERLKKYIKETKKFIYPLLRQVKETYPESSNYIYVLKYHIISMITASEKIVEALESKNNT